MNFGAIAGGQVTNWCYAHQWSRDTCIDPLLPSKELGTVLELVHTLIRLSLVKLLLNTSIALLRTASSAVCSRTLMRSNGWPAKTEQIPPIAPAASERMPGKDELSSQGFLWYDLSCSEELACILKENTGGLFQRSRRCETGRRLD